MALHTNNKWKDNFWVWWKPLDDTDSSRARISKCLHMCASETGDRGKCCLCSRPPVALCRVCRIGVLYPDPRR